MKVYKLYLANYHRQKVSDYWHVKAPTLLKAHKIIYEANPGIDWLNLELLEA